MTAKIERTNSSPFKRGEILRNDPGLQTFMEKECGRGDEKGINTFDLWKRMSPQTKLI